MTRRDIRLAMRERRQTRRGFYHQPQFYTEYTHSKEQHRRKSLSMSKWPWSLIHCSICRSQCALRSHGNGLTSPYSLSLMAFGRLNVPA